jgi:hypothetical protein
MVTERARDGKAFGGAHAPCAYVVAGPASGPGLLVLVLQGALSGRFRRGLLRPFGRARPTAPLVGRDPPARGD